MYSFFLIHLLDHDVYYCLLIAMDVAVHMCRGSRIFSTEGMLVLVVLKIDTDHKAIARVAQGLCLASSTGSSRGVAQAADTDQEGLGRRRVTEPSRSTSSAS